MKCSKNEKKKNIGDISKAFLRLLSISTKKGISLILSAHVMEFDEEKRDKYSIQNQPWWLVLKGL